MASAALHRVRRQQRAEHHHRLGAQPAAEREPEAEEQGGRRPRRTGAAPHGGTEARQQQAADHQPARDPHDERRHPQPQHRVADLRPRRVQLVEPAEGGLRHVEPAVVVADPARRLRGAGHREDVAVVDGHAADHGPDGQRRDDGRVPAGPAAARPADRAGTAAVRLVGAPQRPQARQQCEHGGRADERLEGRRAAVEPVVDLDAHGGAVHVVAGAVEVGVDAHDLRPLVPVDVGEDHPAELHLRGGGGGPHREVARPGRQRRGGELRPAVGHGQHAIGDGRAQPDGGACGSARGSGAEDERGLGAALVDAADRDAPDVRGEGQRAQGHRGRVHGGGVARCARPEHGRRVLLHGHEGEGDCERRGEQTEHRGGGGSAA